MCLRINSASWTFTPKPVKRLRRLAEHSNSGNMIYYPQNYVDALKSKLRDADDLIERCRNAAGRIEIGLYDDLQSHLHFSPPLPPSENELITKESIDLMKKEISEFRSIKEGPHDY